MRWLLAVLVLCCVSAAQAQPSALRVVSLLPSLTETVCYLGHCDALVGVDRYSNEPPQVKQLPQLGGLDDTPIEMLLQLKPSLVLMGENPRLQQKLITLGLNVHALRSDTLAQARESFITVASLLKVPDGAAQWQKLVDTIPAAAPAEQLLLYIEVDRTPYAAGAASFMGHIAARVGFRNIVPETMPPFPRLGVEYILQHNPQVIVISASELPNLIKRNGWQELTAVKNNAICAFNAAEADILTRPGPRLPQAVAFWQACWQKVRMR